MTLIQFLYLLTGGIVDYILLTITGGNFIFWIFGIPIAIASLGLAFLKIQDQPLSHFVKAGLFYWNRPKLRVWQRQGYTPPIFKEAPKAQKVEQPIAKHQIDKSELERLAQSLDTQPIPAQEAKNFGKTSENFEKLLSEQPKGQVKSS